MGATPSDTTRTVETDSGDVTYESDMPMKALNKIMRAGKDSDLEALQEGLSEFVLSWPFEGEPSDVEAWGELKRSQFNEVTAGVLGDLGEMGNE